MPISQQPYVFGIDREGNIRKDYNNSYHYLCRAFQESKCFFSQYGSYTQYYRLIKTSCLVAGFPSMAT